MERRRHSRRRLPRRYGLPLLLLAAGAPLWLANWPVPGAPSIVPIQAPYAVAVGPGNRIYVADHVGDCVWIAGGWGPARRFAGTGWAGFEGDGGPATAARLSEPTGLACDAHGSVYIADASNHRVRRVGRDGIIRTVAGHGFPDYSGDGGPASRAGLSLPSAVACAPDGGLLISDYGNGILRKVDPRGTIHSVRIGGRPVGIALAHGGEVYAACEEHDLLQKRGPTGRVTTVGRFQDPTGVAVDSHDALYVSSLDGCVYRVPARGRPVVVAGTGAQGSSPDGVPARRAMLSLPMGIALGRDGSLYVVEYGAERVRRLGPGGILGTVVAGPVYGRWGYE